MNNHSSQEEIVDIRDYIITPRGIRILGNIIRAHQSRARGLIKTILLIQKPSESDIRMNLLDLRFHRTLINDLIISVSDGNVLAVETAVRRLTNPVYLRSDIDLDRFIDSVVLEYELDHYSLINHILNHIVYAPLSEEIFMLPPISVEDYSDILENGSHTIMEQVMDRLQHWYERLYGDQDEYDMLKQMQHRTMRLYSSLLSQGLHDKNAAEYILAVLRVDRQLLDECLMDLDVNQDQIRLTKYRTRLI